MDGQDGQDREMSGRRTSRVDQVQESSRCLLITGAAGRIGTYYRGHLATHRAPWRLRLQDLRA